MCAAILGELTLNDIDMLQLDGDPTLSGGTVAPQGSIAIATVSGIAKIWIKTGTLATDWVELVQKSDTKYFRVGFLPTWYSSTQITLGKGAHVDDSNLTTISSDSNITVDITVSGAGGLDTGVRAANTFYYVWVISTSTGTTSAIFSTSRTSPTLPSGYVYKRLLPFACRTDGSSNIYNFKIMGGWPEVPEIRYLLTFGSSGNTTQVYSGNLPSSYTVLSLASWVPPISTTSLMCIQIFEGPNKNCLLRETGATHNGVLYQSSGNPTQRFAEKVPTNSSQTIDIRGVNDSLLPVTGISCTLSIVGFIVSGV